MARWQPNGMERLQEAAMTLFHERGYADVTVEHIAERAGLTKRSFFNHFPDKREVLFAGAPAMELDVARYVSEADADQTAISAAMDALTRAGDDLARYGSFARIRRDIIATSPELRERSLIKMASLSSAIATSLEARGTQAAIARLVADTAVTVFSAAYDEWVEAPELAFEPLMRRTLADLNAATGTARSARSRHSTTAPAASG